MKTFNRNNLSALLALTLGILVLTSAKSTETIATTDLEPVVEDFSYMDDVEEYVDAYFDELIQEESLFTDYVKVYNGNDELLLEGERSSFSDSEMKVLHQADLLTQERGTAYYQLNN